MSKYIKVEDAIEAAINGCSSWDGGYSPSMDDPIKEEFDAVADKCIELVRCGECRHRDPEDKKCDHGWMFFSFPRPDDGYCEHGER